MGVAERERDEWKAKAEAKPVRPSRGALIDALKAAHAAHVTCSYRGNWFDAYADALLDSDLWATADSRVPGVEWLEDRVCELLGPLNDGEIVKAATQIHTALVREMGGE